MDSRRLPRGPHRTRGVARPRRCNASTATCLQMVPVDRACARFEASLSRQCRLHDDSGPSRSLLDPERPLTLSSQADCPRPCACGTTPPIGGTARRCSIEILPGVLATLRRGWRVP
jgi:hypothetical protein